MSGPTRAEVAGAYDLARRVVRLHDQGAEMPALCLRLADEIVELLGADGGGGAVSAPARFTASEFLVLVAAVNLLTEEAAEEGTAWTRAEVNAADRALRKVQATLTPDQHREVNWRLSK